MTIIEPVYISQWSQEASARIEDCGPTCCAMFFRARGDMTPVNRLLPGDTTGATNGPDLIGILKDHNIVATIEYSDPNAPLAFAVPLYSILLVNYTPLAPFAQDVRFTGPLAWHWLIYMGVDPNNPNNSLTLDPDYWGARIKEGDRKPYPTEALRKAFRAYNTNIPGAMSIHVQDAPYIPPSDFIPHDVEAISPVNIRSGPGMNYPIISGLNTGNIATAQSWDNGWLKIDAPIIGYVNAAYTKPHVSIPPIITPNGAEADRRVSREADPYLKVRSGPGVTFPQIGQVYSGDQVRVLMPIIQDGGVAWYQFKNPVNGQTAFAAALFLLDTPPSPTSPPTFTTPTRSANSDIYGINIDPYNPRANPPSIQLSGCSRVRFVLQAHSRNTTLDQAIDHYQQFIVDCAAQGTKVVLAINAETEATSIPWRNNGLSWEGYIPFYIAAIHRIVARLGKYLYAIEVFNEPDDPNGTPIPAPQFGKLVNATYEVLKDTGIHTISGGLMQSAAMNVTYLKAAALDPGVRIGIHPYGQVVTRSSRLADFGQLTDYLDIIQAAFPPSIYDLSATEWGIARINVRDQTLWPIIGNYMRETFTVFHTRPGITDAIWFSWGDQDSDGILSDTLQPNGDIWQAFEDCKALDHDGDAQPPAPPHVGA